MGGIESTEGACFDEGDMKTDEPFQLSLTFSGYSWRQRHQKMCEKELFTIPQVSRNIRPKFS